MKKIKFVIWGAGIRGRRMPFHIGKENVLAFIDSNPELEGKIIDDIEVISKDTYIEKYSDCCVIISTQEEEIEAILKENKIKNYYKISQFPEDFVSANPRNLLKEHIVNNIEKNKKYVIYGNSLYSILLFSWLQQNNKSENCYLIMGNNCCVEMVERLKEEWGEKVKENLEELQTEIDNILVTLEETEEYDIPQNLNKKIINIYRYSEKHKVYYNPLLEQFKNIHQGKRCFLVATGPSLRKEDLDTLDKNKEICIGVNSIYKIFNETNWRPDYYFTADSACMREEEFALEFFKDKCCFIADNYEDFNKKEKDKNIYIYHAGQFTTKYSNLPFSEDIASIIYTCGTVTYPAIELAAYMGFKEIYLLGVDATGINGKSDSYAHFYNEKVLVSQCREKQVILAYNTAKKYADNHGIKIYNATRGGELEIFDRVNFDSIF